MSRSSSISTEQNVVPDSVKHLLVLGLGLIMAIITPHPLQALDSTALPRSEPESQGVSSEAIAAFVQEASDKIDSLHSVMLVRHGHVIAEGWWKPYDAESRHELYSLSKSFTSTAVGLAIQEGKFSLDDPVLSFFPEEAPAEPSSQLKGMRVRDLLCMSTGHESEPPLGKEDQWVKKFLAHKVPFKPGTHFLYNTPATYMLSAIVQKQTGKTTLEYLSPRLFEPLGIESPTWGTSPQGVSLGGYGLSVRTEDIAKFGQLYLQRGTWDGKQIIAPEWIDAATSRQTSNGSNPNSDWDQGYGYQFWRCRHGAYRGDGAFGQYCVVLPEHGAVIAITSGVKDMQQVLNLVWDKLLPAYQKEPLPPNSAANSRLKLLLSQLEIPLPKGESTSENWPKIAGRTYAFPTNEQKISSLEITNGAGDIPVAKVTVDGEVHVWNGGSSWKRGSVPMGGVPVQIASASAWPQPETLEFKVCYRESPYIQSVSLHWDDDKVRLETKYNVGFGPTTRPAIEGTLRK